MSTRIHLLICIDPIRNGDDVEAICGEVIPKAHAVPLTDFSEVQRSTIQFCKKCFGRQYFYAVSTGQEAHDASLED
jgi:hypothetical protein